MQRPVTGLVKTSCYVLYTSALNSFTNLTLTVHMYNATCYYNFCMQQWMQKQQSLYVTYEEMVQAYAAVIAAHCAMVEAYMAQARQVDTVRCEQSVLIQSPPRLVRLRGKVVTPSKVPDWQPRACRALWLPDLSEDEEVDA